MSAGIVDLGPAVVLCGPAMREYSRKSMGARWCFRHRRHEQFDWVVYEEVEPSYWGPTVAVEGPTSDCTDLFPGWSREWDE